ncbi:hypothetical protein NPIL_376951 [Nephila pilipes]|uniref:Secreted protein n=1 Tax=Nephila pilipes TaxID=299642 RepID=A0A8X6PAN2_NEPPI|nr:hypothetical protein NPIL_376951 [Nephila pilipes]
MLARSLVCCILRFGISTGLSDGAVCGFYGCENDFDWGKLRVHVLLYVRDRKRSNTSRETAHSRPWSGASLRCSPSKYHTWKSALVQSSESFRVESFTHFTL